MTISFRPAIRENVGLLIGLAGGTGSGKTYTALELAAGIAGDRPVALIDTEARRGLHYADQFRFDHADMRPPFSPDAYAEAILAADAADYPVIVVDSMSHEHAGDGGLLDWHDAELDRMAGTDWKRREKMTMSAWIAPKTAHKRMVQKLLQVRAHLILCFRAEEKIEIGRDENGKTVIVPKVSVTGLDGWIPVAEKTLPYELTASFLLVAREPGVPKPIKLQAQHRHLFPLDRQITRESGARIAEWASGGTGRGIDWHDKIATALTLDALVAVWKSIPAADKPAFIGAKDARKAALDAPPVSSEVALLRESIASAVLDRDVHALAEVRRLIDLASGRIGRDATDVLRAECAAGETKIKGETT